MPRQGLVHYWPITEANTFDVVGGKDLSIVENVTRCTDRFGAVNSALSFASGFGTMPNGIYLSTGGFTISFWIKIDANFVKQLEHGIINFGNGPANDQFSIQQFGKTGALNIRMNNGTQTVVEQYYSYQMTQGLWYHMAYAVDAANYGRNYLNGLVDIQYPSEYIINDFIPFIHFISFIIHFKR